MNYTLTQTCAHVLTFNEVVFATMIGVGAVLGLFLIIALVFHTDKNPVPTPHS